MRRIWCLLIIVLILGNAAVSPAAQGESSASPEKPWSVDLRMKRYFASHTSYDFGNPFFPYQAPLSRLEFPLNTLWGGAEIRRNIGRFSGGVEATKNLTGESDGVFKEAACNVFKAFSGEGYARMDFRLSGKNEVYFLEVNFACSVFYPEGYYGSADYILMHDELGHAGFLSKIIEEGLARHARKQKSYFVKHAGCGLWYLCNNEYPLRRGYFQW